MSKSKPVFWVEGKRTFRSLSEAARKLKFQDTAFHIASRTSNGVFEFGGQHFQKTLMTAEDKTCFVLKNLKKADDLLEQAVVEMNASNCPPLAKSLALQALKSLSMAILLTKGTGCDVPDDPSEASMMSMLSHMKAMKEADK